MKSSMSFLFDIPGSSEFPTPYLDFCWCTACFFRNQTVLAQVFGSVLATTSKLVVGKEGTMTNVGACIAHMLATQVAKFIGSSGGSKRRHADGNKSASRQGFSEADMRDLVTVGAAAGISACFRAPVRISSPLSGILGVLGHIRA